VYTCDIQGRHIQKKMLLKKYTFFKSVHPFCL